MPRILAVLAILAWVIILSPYPKTLFMAGAIACLTLPLYHWLRARMSSIGSIAAYTAVLSFSIITPFAIVTVLITPQIISGISRLNQWRASGWALSPEIAQFIEGTKVWVAKVPGLDEWLTEMTNNISEISNTILKSAVSGSIGIAGGTMTVLVLLFLFVILSALCVVYAPTISKLVLRVTRLPEDSFGRMVQSTRNALRAVVMGVVLVATVQGTLTGIGLRLVGVPEPAFWGLLAIFVAVIPIVGTALIWVPMALMLWLQGSLGAAVGLVAWGLIVVAGSDNFLRPYFLKTGIEAPVFVLLLSILCSMAVFGALGLILGPVLVALAQQAVKESDILLQREMNEEAE